MSSALGFRRSPSVDPAHAGITPVWAMASATVSRRPRTRGDYPASRTRSRFSQTSTPHTRGLPWWLCLGTRAAEVDPAHAGITRSAFTSRARESRRPRTRGDYPFLDALGVLVKVVDPAHAGITLPVFSRINFLLGRPRTRGDYPVPLPLLPISDRSTPHTRGLPVLFRGGSRPYYVDPAHAGITPPTDHTRSDTTRRPRTRGDYPSLSELELRGELSTPHTRGLPDPRCSCRLVVSSRPRTRGDYP